MLRFRILIVCAVFAWVPAPLALAANEAQQVFDSLYGPRIRAVKATADRADDFALAKELLDVAGTSTETPGLLALLCEASYDLSSKHADGFATAAQAMSLLAEHVEPKRTDAREKLVDVLMKQSRLGKADEREAAGESLIDTLLTMGDEKMEAKQWSDATGDYRRAMTIAAPKKSPKLDMIKAKLELAMRRDRAVKQITRLSEKLLADANDSAAAEEIVKLYVVEFGDPQSALPYLNRVKDEQFKKFVPLAAKAVGDVAADDCLNLGEWLRSLAVTGFAPVDASLLRQAAASIDRFIASTSADALKHKKGTLLRAAIDNSLKGLEESASLTNRAIRNVVDPKGLIIHYVFDEKYRRNGVIRNLAADKWHGKIAGGTLKTSDIGPSIVFHARGHYIDSGFNDALARWSFAAWIYGDHEPAKTNELNTGPIHRESAFQLAWSHANNDFVGVFTTEVKGDWLKIPLGKIEAKRWYHVAATYDGELMSGYVNGRLVGQSKSGGGSATVTPDTLKLGCHARNTDNAWSGAMCDFYLYSRALSDKEIAKLAELKQ